MYTVLITFDHEWKGVNCVTILKQISFCFVYVFNDFTVLPLQGLTLINCLKCKNIATVNNFSQAHEYF